MVHGSAHASNATNDTPPTVTPRHEPVTAYSATEATTATAATIRHVERLGLQDATVFIRADS